MAFSGDTAFSMTAGDVIKKALQKLAVLEEGQAASTNQNTDGLVDLNMMIKGLSRHGLQLWTVESVDIDPLVEGQAQYTLGKDGSPSEDTPRPIMILEASVVDSDNNEITLIPLSRNEYDNLTPKTTKGKPVQYYYDPQILNVEINIWPTPDANSASNDKISMYVQQYIQDVDATDDMYFPAEWFEAVVYQLAVRLAPDYGIPLQERRLLERKADQYLAETLAWDQEDASIYFKPEFRGQKRG